MRDYPIMIKMTCSRVVQAYNGAYYTLTTSRESIFSINITEGEFLNLFADTCNSYCSNGTMLLMKKAINDNFIDMLNNKSITETYKNLYCMRTPDTTGLTVQVQIKLAGNGSR